MDYTNKRRYQTNQDDETRRSSGTDDSSPSPNRPRVDNLASPTIQGNGTSARTAIQTSGNRGKHRRPSNSRNGNRGHARCIVSDKVMKAIQKADTKSNPKSSEGPIYPPEKGGLVLFDPEESERWNGLTNRSGYVPVVVSPKFKNLKVEQELGIQFMFDHFNQDRGCILAHEQGTGKTLTTIVLCHTLLEQSFKSRGISTPSVRKIVIVVPKHMVSNWLNEFREWLDQEYCDKKVRILRTKPKVDEEILDEFISKDCSFKILIMSYSNMKKYHRRYFRGDILPTSDPSTSNSVTSSDGSGKFDLLICDEVHTLKNPGSQVSQIHDSLQFKIKIGLTGTPVQNTLENLIQIINFAQPGELLRKSGLETEDQFYKKYILPFSKIELDSKSWIPSTQEKLLMEELKSFIEPVLHIRSNPVDVDKHEMIIVTELSPKQKELYKELSDLVITGDFKTKTKSRKFLYTAITTLKSICAHPKLIENTVKKWSSALESLDQIMERHINEGGYESDDSVKIQFVLCLLLALKKKYNYEVKINTSATLDRVVVVSNRTELLDTIEEVLKSIVEDGLEIFPLVKFDGKTSNNNKLQAVKRFNDPKENLCVILLSAKAGGTGINLVGGNHLVILDPDWNPANDEQAMARIWRQGQSKTCYMYRLLCTGTVEEVQMNRQLSKNELKEYVTKASVTKMDVLGEHAKAIYAYKENTLSSLHDAISCSKDSCNSGVNSPAEVGSPINEEFSPNSEPSPGVPDPNNPNPLNLESDLDPEIEDDDDIESVDSFIDDEVDEEEDKINKIFVTNDGERDVSSLSKWNHYPEPNKDTLRSNMELAILSLIWNFEPEDIDPSISFAFHKKTDKKNRLRVDDAEQLIHQTILRRC